jgi:hypothetical protein
MRRFLSRKGIPNRKVLAERLELPENTVRRNLSEDFEGETTHTLPVVLCNVLDGNFHKLIEDPRNYR